MRALWRLGQNTGILRFAQNDPLEVMTPAKVGKLSVFRDFFDLLGHFGGAFEFVPVEGFAVDGSLDGLEEDDGEDLAVGEALDPDVDEEPSVAFAGGVFAFEREGEGRGEEVDDEEGCEEEEQLVEAVG